MTCCLSLMDSLKSYCTDRYRNMYNHILPFVGRHDHKVLVVVRCMSTLIYLSINIKSTYIICWPRSGYFLVCLAEYCGFNLQHPKAQTPEAQTPEAQTLMGILLTYSCSLPSHYNNNDFIGIGLLFGR